MQPGIYRKQHEAPAAGFTLVEIAIVLIIIGAIAGVVLVGKDLIDASTIRSQISQVDQYNAAANAFKLKYGYLPGDIPEPDASKFGFAARGPYAGQGDGNGMLEGFTANAPNSNKGSSQTGENMMFWVDLSKAEMISDSFSTMTATSLLPPWPLDVPQNLIHTYIPPAKIGNDNFMHVYSFYDANYFGLINVYYMRGPSDLWPRGRLTVQQAYNIDTKLDDGLPMSGNVSVQVISKASSGGQGVMWQRDNNGAYGCSSSYGLDPCTFAKPATDTSCVDNNNVEGVIPVYSIKHKGGIGRNCALSFKFQ